MATIQDLKTQIENANALGRTNLSEKGVKLPETATTYNIMTAIAEISGGGGVTYTSIVYNTDNTVTLTDKDGAIHTMSCTYADGKLIGVTYDGKAVDLTYNGDALVKVGKTSVDVANAPVNIAALDHTVTFTVDGKPYEIVSVKAGNSVNAPYNPPIKAQEGLACMTWKDNNDNIVNLPCSPTENIVLFGVWEKIFDGLFLIDGNDIPIVERVSDMKPTVNKVSTVADGKFGNAIVFGSKQWLKYTSDIYKVGLNDFTLECWAKPNDMSPACGKLFSWYNGSNGRGFMTLKKDIVSWEESGTTSANINIDDGQFHHIAFVRHNQVNRIYVDGVMVAESSGINNLTDNVLFIGVNGAFDGYESEYFDGLVDNIAFFNYAKYTTDFVPLAIPYVIVRDEQRR